MLSTLLGTRRPNVVERRQNHTESVKNAGWEFDGLGTNARRIRKFYLNAHRPFRQTPWFAAKHRSLREEPSSRRDGHRMPSSGVMPVEDGRYISRRVARRLHAD